MSVRGFNTRSGIEQYDYDYLDNKPDAPTKDSIGLGNVDNTSDMGKPVSTAQEQALSQKVDKVPGMGLSQEDYTSAEKEKLGDLPTNEELEADLAGKASAEIVAALESAVNDPDNGLETKASAIINTASGAIASFADGADSMPVKKLVVAVEPQQDLHGYDHPWPAGGGKNIADPSKIYLFSSGTYVGTNNYATQGAFDVESNTQYTISSVSSGNDLRVIFWDSNGTEITPRSQVAVFTTPANCVKISFYRQLDSAVSDVNSAKVMIAKGTDTTFSPYSNECPISGWTGAEIERDGKNLLDDSLLVHSVNITAGDHVFTEINADSKPSIVTTLQAYNNRAFVKVVAEPGAASPITLIKDDTYNELVFGHSGSTIDAKIFLDVSGLPNGRYKFWYTIISNTHPFKFGYLMVTKEDDTDATFAPYQSNQISVTFPSEAGTVYGATLTVNPDRTGTLVVDRAMVDMGTLNWEYLQAFDGFQAPTNPIAKNNFTAISSKYKYVGSYARLEDKSFAYIYNNAVIVRDSAYSDATSFKPAMSGVQLVYELATPITYTLTESEISGILTTLYGTNNIWADCGDSTVEYTCDTRLFIEQLTQPTEDDMTADHAISAGMFFQLGNTLYLATSQIAAGATITPGTNATKLSLADALNQLNA